MANLALFWLIMGCLKHHAVFDHFKPPSNFSPCFTVYLLHFSLLVPTPPHPPLSNTSAIYFPSGNTMAGNYWPVGKFLPSLVWNWLAYSRPIMQNSSPLLLRDFTRIIFQGCSSRISDFIRQNQYTILGVVLAILLIQLLGLVFAFVLCFAFRRQDRADYYNYW